MSKSGEPQIYHNFDLLHCCLFVFSFAGQNLPALSPIVEVAPYSMRETARSDRCLLYSPFALIYQSQNDPPRRSPACSSNFAFRGGP